jgi:hypothetical protein
LGGGGGIAGSGSVINQKDENEKDLGEVNSSTSEPIKSSWKELFGKNIQIISRRTVDTKNIQEQNKTYPNEPQKSPNCLSAAINLFYLTGIVLQLTINCITDQIRFF